MTSLRHWLGPGARLLADYLEQLRESLEALAERLRASIAHAIGTAVGGLARDALRYALDELVAPGPGRTRALASARLPSSGGGAYRPSEDFDERTGQDGFWPEEVQMEEVSASALHQPSPQVRSAQRLAVSVVAGLQAAWTCRRSFGRSSLLALLAVGLVVGCAAYAAPAVATAGLVLAGSAGQLGLLSG